MEVHFSTYNKKFNASQIDAKNGVIYGVALANGGKNKKGYYFTERFLNELKAFGDEKGRIKARFEHPKFGTSDFGSLIGWYKDFRIENGNLYGDLYIADVAKRTQVAGRGIMIADYVLSIATECPDMFGNSISTFAEEVVEEVTDEEGTHQVVSLKLYEWVASDLVDVPAATNGLFFSRNINKVNNMNVIEKLKIFATELNKVFAKAKLFDVDLTLANGDIITVVTEGEAPVVGDKVKQKTDGGEDAEKPLADGEYLLKDKSTLVVEGGAIKEIKKKETAKPDEGSGESEEFATQVAQCFEVISERLKAIEEAFEKMKKVQSSFNVDEPRGASNEPNNGKKAFSLDEIRKKLGR